MTAEPLREHTRTVSEELHTHLEFGFEPNCPACDLTLEQLQIGAGLLERKPVLAGTP